MAGKGITPETARTPGTAVSVAQGADWVSDCGTVRLWLGKCENIMPYLGRYDACLTDPPYGIGEAAGKNKSRGNMATAKDYGDLPWDNDPASPEALALIQRLARWQIIFGGNYFGLPPSSCWLVWDKLNGENDYADCELAWTNLKKAVRRIQFRWNGMIRDEDGERVHPTQKPIGVLSWCLGHLPAGTQTVIDPYIGSGTTALACIRKGLRCDGIESHEPYFLKAIERITADRERPLFDPKPTQRAMFEEKE
jgi:DNA modification methylase